jgi:hypothetical protein
MRRPATAMERYCVMPSVEACAEGVVDVDIHELR